MGVNLRGTLRVVGKQDSLFPTGLVYPRELMSFEPRTQDVLLQLESIFELGDITTRFQRH